VVEQVVFDSNGIWVIASMGLEGMMNDWIDNWSLRTDTIAIE
jgi:hypothetical protein